MGYIVHETASVVASVGMAVVVAAVVVVAVVVIDVAAVVGGMKAWLEVLVARMDRDTADSGR